MGGGREDRKEEEDQRVLGFSASEIRPPLTKLSSHRSKISYIHSRQVFRGGGGGVKRSRKRQSKRRTREKLHESKAAAPSWKCPSKESWKKVFSFKATDIWLFSPYEIPRERRLALSLISSAKPRRTDWLQRERATCITERGNDSLFVAWLTNEAIQNRERISFHWPLDDSRSRILSFILYSFEVSKTIHPLLYYSTRYFKN